MNTATVAAPPAGGAAVLELVRAAISRYVSFPGEASLASVTLWVVHTHAFSYASATPYLNVHSPAPRCGKSTLFEVLSMLVRDPVGGSNMSPAVLYRLIDERRPTLLIDEMDAQMRADKERASALQSILNAGYKTGPGALVWRCEAQSHTPVSFAVFCPKAFAGVGTGILHPTTLDRCIPVLLERKLPGDPVHRFRGSRFEAEATVLRERISDWVEQASETLDRAEPPLPDELDDRTQEIWEPLIAIADAAGADWPVKARQAALALHIQPDLEDLPLGILLLTDIRAIFDKADVWTLSSDELANDLNLLDESPWSGFSSHGVKTGMTVRALARLLRPFGVRPKTVRFPGDGDKPTRKGYRREWFEPAWARYVPDQPADANDET